MKLTIALFDKIEAYLSGAMTVQERILFDKEISQSLELKAIVEDQRQKRLGDLENQFKNFLNRDFDEDETLPKYYSSNKIIQNKTDSKILRLWKKASLIRIAAGILLVIGVVWWISKSGISNQERAELASLAGESEIFAGVNTDDTLCDCGLGLRKEYSNGYDSKYKSLLNKLIEINASDTLQNECVLYWKGWINIQNEQYTTSTSLFEKLWKETSVSLFHQRIGMGLMRALLMSKNDTRLLEIANQILEEKVYYQPAHDFAKEIKKRI